MVLWLLCPCLFLPPLTLALRFVIGQLSLASALHPNLCPWLRDWTQRGDTLIPAKAHLCGLGPQAPLCPTPTQGSLKEFVGPHPKLVELRSKFSPFLLGLQISTNSPSVCHPSDSCTGVSNLEKVSIFPTARFLNPPPSRSAFFPCYFESQSWIKSQGSKS